MSREVHVRFCEGPKVKLLRPTHPYIPMAAASSISSPSSTGSLGACFRIGCKQEKSASEGSAATSLDLPIADDANKVETGSGQPELIRLIVPVRLKRRGNEMKFIVEGGTMPRPPNR